MENRIAGRFVIHNGHIFDSDGMSDLTDLVLGSFGTRGENNGRLVDITINVKTSDAKPWPTCPQTTNYGTGPCGALIRPGLGCTAEHYHRPAWVTDDDGIHTCSTCEDLNIEPSQPYTEDANTSRYTYNHCNTAKDA